MICIWCESQKIGQISVQNKTYHHCQDCEFIFLDSAHRLDLKSEEQRYLLHQNIVTDEGYQNFVAPLKNAVLGRFTSNHLGLDFGSGKDSAISYSLRKQDYNVKQYDPFFQPDVSVLKSAAYDYIIICEVAEHFYNPKAEFLKLKSYLKTGGVLFVMTSLRTRSVDFKTWSYRRDSTHVCFYTEKTLQKQFKTEVSADNLILLSSE